MKFRMIYSRLETAFKHYTFFPSCFFPILNNNKLMETYDTGKANNLDLNLFLF